MASDPTNIEQYTSPVQQANFKINAVHDVEEYQLRIRLAEKSNEYEVVIPGSVAPGSFHIKHGDLCWETLSRRPQTGSGKVRVWVGFSGYVVKKSRLGGHPPFSSEWCELAYEAIRSDVRFVGFAATESNLKNSSLTQVENQPTVWCGGQCQIVNNGPATITRGSVLAVRPPRPQEKKPENYTDGRDKTTHQTGIPFTKVTGIVEAIVPEHFISRPETVEFMKSLLGLNNHEQGDLLDILNDKTTEYGTTKRIREKLLNDSNLKGPLLKYGNAHVDLLNNQCARAQGNAMKGQLLTIQILQIQI